MPAPQLRAIRDFGATIVTVPGTYDDAFDACRRACETNGWRCIPDSATEARDETVTRVTGVMIDRASVRLAATLLIVGQFSYIVVTLFHADGVANDHAAAFAEYAASEAWTGVHAGQFAAMAVLLGGLIELCLGLDQRTSSGRWGSRFAVAAATVALALYGALQAVDGVANKQADVAWVSASEAEKVARFASAEAVRWIEWGLRSYQAFALGLALLLGALAAARTRRLPRSIAYTMGLSGIAYWGQGWVVGIEGFSQTMSIAIVAGWILGVAWITPLAVVAWRMPDSTRGDDVAAVPFSGRMDDR